MFKLLFAEDERSAREGIMECIPWEELDITVIAACKNGREAYEKAVECRPDILLTDIKMAQMDGLTLTKKIRELYPDCSIIIISGYAETDYLKSAISLNVIDYIYKPIDLSLLHEKLKLAASVQREKLETKEMLRHKLSSMLCYPQFDPYEVQRLFTTLFPFYQTDTPIRICYLNVLFQSLKRVPESELYTLLPSVSELLSGLKLHFVAALHKGCIVLTLLCRKEATPNLWETIYSALLHAYPTLKFYLCIGQAAPLKEYSHAKNSADSALEKLFFCPENRHLLYGHIQSTDYKGTFQAIDLQPFSAFLKEGDIAAAKGFVSEITNKSLHNGRPSPMQIAELYHQLFHLLYQSTLSDQEQKAASAHDLLNEHIFYFLIERQLLSEIDSCFSSVYSIHQKLNLEEVSKYIGNNFGDHSLSLEQVSRHFYMSTTWFCIHFKEATGKTFVRYLTEYRIQRAMEYLARTNMKINDIAEKTGFNDSNYFTKIFKKETGSTPKDFRKKLNSGKASL